jgi:predicted ATPase/DNA-binding SARP family transcriptional activator
VVRQNQLAFLGGSRYGSGLPALLLARLALAGESGCNRDDLTAAFWPGDDPAAARPRLRQILLHARRALAEAGLDPTILQSDRNTIRFDFTRITLDIAEFQAALKNSDWTRADTLYTGDFLPGHSDSVITAEREHLRMAHRSALRHLTEIYERAGERERALQTAARHAALEPYDDEAGLRLLRLLIQTGNVAEAHHHYRRLKRRLRTGNSERLLPEARKQVRQWFAEAARTARTTVPPEPVEDRGPGATVPFVRPTDPLQFLPAVVSRFFGRETEIRQILALLRPQENRLLTLIGPAGSGKSRLALEIARRMASERTPYFVSLADITNYSQFGGKMIRALNVPRDPSLPPLDQIIQVLRHSERPPLVILDNVEHLLEQPEFRAAFGSLLAAVPELQFLGTSRQPLEIAGEREFTVSPLPLPEPWDSESVTTTLLQASPATALFIDRIQAVRPGFQVTTRNAHAIAALCHQLDGLPLALEIVATWARILTPAQMLTQLTQAESRRSLLTSRRPSASDSPRHASLQAAIDWSYRRLSPEEQHFFVQLPVFRGGFTVEAAAAISDAPQALPFLATLQERSFVQVTEHPSLSGEPVVRYRLLTTIREFGREQLSPEENERLFHRHAQYYVDLAERAEREMLRPDQILWGERLHSEIDNIRTVGARCLVGSVDLSLGLRLGGALWRFYSMSHYVREGREFLQSFLRLAPPPTAPLPGRAKTLFTLSNLAFYQGDAEEGIRYARECIAVPHLPEDAWIVAFAQTWLGVMLFFCGRFDEARQELSLGLRQSQAVGEDWLVGYALMQSGLCAFFTGNYENVTHYCEESLIRVERLQEKILAGLNFLVLGLYYYYVTGNSQLSEDYCRRSIAHFAATNDVWVFMLVRCQFAFVLTREGRLSEAKAIHEDVVVRFEKLGDPHGMAQGLEGLGEIAALEGDDTNAALLWGAAQERRQQITIPVWPFLRPFRETVVSKTRARLGEEAFRAIQARGRTLSLEELRIPVNTNGQN